MNPVQTNLSVQEIEAWGDRIANEINRVSQEQLGDQSVKVQADSEVGKKIEQLALELLKDYPRAANDCVYIRSTYSIQPSIVVAFSDLEPILEETAPGSLFKDEVGKKITINNLATDIYGSFIEQPTCLELRNIVVPQNCQFLKNAWTKEKVHEESNTHCVNSHRTVGVVDIDPNLETTEIVATVRFGNVIRENQTLTIKTRNRENGQVVIPLAHLNMTAKIRYDGEVSLPNGKTFTIDQIISAKSLVMIGSPITTKFCFNIVTPDV